MTEDTYTLEDTDNTYANNIPMPITNNIMLTTHVLFYALKGLRKCEVIPENNNFLGKAWVTFEKMIQLVG